MQNFPMFKWQPIRYLQKPCVGQIKQVWEVNAASGTLVHTVSWGRQMTNRMTGSEMSEQTSPVLPQRPRTDGQPSFLGGGSPIFSSEPGTKHRRRSQGKTPLSGRPFTSNLLVNAFSSTHKPRHLLEWGAWAAFSDPPPKMLVLTAVRPRT